MHELLGIFMHFREIEEKIDFKKPELFEIISRLFER